MTILTVNNADFNLLTMERAELFDLAKSICADIECHSFYQNAEEYDKSRAAFDKLLEYIIFCQ